VLLQLPVPPLLRVLPLLLPLVCVIWNGNKNEAIISRIAGASKTLLMQRSFSPSRYPTFSKATLRREYDRKIHDNVYGNKKLIRKWCELLPINARANLLWFYFVFLELLTSIIDNACKISPTRSASKASNTGERAISSVIWIFLGTTVGFSSALLKKDPIHFVL